MPPISDTCKGYRNRQRSTDAHTDDTDAALLSSIQGTSNTRHVATLAGLETSQPHVTTADEDIPTDSTTESIAS